MHHDRFRLLVFTGVVVISMLSCGLPGGEADTPVPAASTSISTGAASLEETPTEVPPSPEPTQTLAPTPTPLIGNIYGYVFQDGNADYIMGNNELGVGGVMVRLRAGSCAVPGLELASTTTIPSGYYYFNGLGVGQYCIDVPTPPFPANHQSPPRNVDLAAGDWIYVDFGFTNVNP